MVPAILFQKIQARADERRNSIDARHQHLFARLAIVLGKDEEWIEECAIADERWQLIEDFFNPGLICLFLRRGEGD